MGKKYFWLLLIVSSSISLLHAQTLDKRVLSIECNQLNLSEVFDLIQTIHPDIKFYYSADNLPEKLFSGKYDTQPVSTVLNDLFTETDLAYYIYRNQAFVIVFEEDMTTTYLKQFYTALDDRLNEGLAPEETIVIGVDDPVNPGDNATIVGRLIDAKTGEPIIGATVFWPEINEGLISDGRGVWELKVPLQKHTLQIQYIGYGAFERQLDVQGNGFLDIKLQSEATDLATVIVLAEANDKNVTRTQAGVAYIAVRRIEELPSLLGEADVVRSIISTAGVSSIGEGSSGFNVRGGAVDQNLILQGGSILFNASHALGFYSSINPQVIKGVTLYKSILPAAYGGRLSSVLQVDMKTSPVDKFKLSGGLGPVTAKLNAALPFSKGKGGALIAFRGANANWLLRQVNVLEVSRSTASFFDVNILANYQLSKKSDLQFSFYGAADEFTFNHEFSFEYETKSMEANYKHKIRKDLDTELSFVVNQFTSKQVDLVAPGQAELTAGVSYLKIKNQYYLSGEETWKLTGGFEGILYKLPGQKRAPLGSTSTVLHQQLQDERAREGALFGEYKWTPNNHWSIAAGLRLNLYQYLGGKEVLDYGEAGIYQLSNVIDTINYASGEVIASYFTFEPRLSIRYQLTDQSSLRGGYSRTSQFINQIFNTDTPSPQSQYQLSTSYVKPFLSHNFSLGYFNNLKNNRWETSIEGFYRAIDQLWDYRDFAELLINDHIETELLDGQGRAYGIEATIKVHSLQIDGQLSYTYSRTEQQIVGINQAQWYAANYDQPHNINLSFKYRIDDRQSLLANFIFASGRPTTAPIADYNAGGTINVPIYTQRNELRIPNYHRLDVSYHIAMNKHKKRRFKTSWDFTIYNLYGHKNPFSVFYTQKVRQTRDFVANRLSVLGSIFPSVSFNFEWL